MGLTKPSPMHWRSSNGTAIEGVLYSPQLTGPGKSHPLVVDLHGGPADVSQVTLSPSEAVCPTQSLVAHGAFVFKPNYRNSSGYGAAFMGDQLQSVGTSEAADVLTGIDALVAGGHVDADRIALVGSSWGDYLTSWLVTHSTRFKAASESSGIIDLPLNYALTDNPTLYQQFFHGSPQTASDL